MIHETSGQLIKLFRERAGFTQEELSAIVGVSVIKLSHWENDETAPRMSMVCTLARALSMSPEEEAQLGYAASVTRTERKQALEKEQAEKQAAINAQNAEIERSHHKRKVWSLLILGACGFAGGFIFTLFMDSAKELLYFPFVIGAVFAGLPYGWGLLTDKDAPRYYHKPTGSLEQDRTHFLIEAFFFLLKFVVSFFVGVFIFPIALFYHAYKAGRKESVWRVLMLIALIVAVTAAICVLLPGILNTIQK